MTAHIQQLRAHVMEWIARDPEPNTQQELTQLIDSESWDVLEDRFSGRLAFGTAGLRGVVGAGPARMNRLVIQEIAAGLGQYLLNTVPEAQVRGVVVGYDGRPDSRQFAEDTAQALMAKGIHVYLTHDVAATPIAAFGVKHLNAAAAVVVTASHNPPEYNGFKVYWENGAQIIPPHDAGIAIEIDHAATVPLQLMSLEEGESKGYLTWLDEAYYAAYQHMQEDSELLTNHHQPEALKLAYTAMHGVGANMAEALLASKGFAHVYSVASQREPDGTFPTVNFPNPEEPGAMDLVIAEANQQGADIAFANDPDADRLAVAARRPDGEFQMLTGDQVGTLLGHYLLAQQPKSLVGNTIVSSSLLAKIANAAGGDYYKTLTGFKWLTNVAMEKQTINTPFLFAYEEALGYTLGTAVWDKDGLSALVAFAQLAAELKEKGQSVWDRLTAIYRQHGFYFNAQKSIALRPDTPNIGQALRETPPTQIAGQTIVLTEDYQRGMAVDASGTETALTLPSSDVLIFQLDDQSRVIVRPSGTEPKIKCYYEVVTEMAEDEDYFTAEKAAKAKMMALMSAHQAALPQ
ncbi:phospho-sugar mutase [Thaumasiovibrio subtropicus]|uniref:phospho-sugar mutase n=1 Tax=Thaumasiovibrio subtropicus TaxID=1891207 RepID=UPI000B34B18E|nr:phospho-sugar mutase [Thaumasiovibrio subtropicus]